MVRAWFIAAIAITSLVAQPCTAQSVAPLETGRQASGFVGLNLNVPLGGAVKPQPSLRLQATLEHRRYDPYAVVPTVFRPRGFELGLSSKGEVAFFLNGESAAEVEKRLELGGTGGTVLIIGGVLLAAGVVIFLVAADDFGDECLVDLHGNCDD